MPASRRLEARIQRHYDELPPAERRLADLLLGFPGNPASYSASELAAMAGTSNAAATRFFRRLGYRDYAELRRQVRDAEAWGSPVYLSGGSSPGDGENGIVARHLAGETANLRRTLEGLRPGQLEEMAAALTTARRVAVVGFRNSRMIAHYFQRQLVLLRPGTALLPAPGQTLAEDLADLGTEDLVVLVAFRRRVAAVGEVARIARERGASLLLVTDPSAMRIVRFARWTLLCEVGSGSLFDSYASAMSLLNLLCGAVFRRMPDRAARRMRRIEALHEELGELLPPDPAPEGTTGCSGNA